MNVRERIPPPANESGELAYTVPEFAALTRANMNTAPGHGTAVDILAQNMAFTSIQTDLPQSPRLLDGILSRCAAPECLQASENVTGAYMDVGVV